MSRGPPALQTIRDAIPIAKIRGMVQMAERGPEMLFDFTIAGTKPVAFVRAKFSEHILAALKDIAWDFNEDICGLRAVTQDAAISCELWLRSRYGTWRFFRVTVDAIVEIGRDGQPIVVKG